MTKFTHDGSRELNAESSNSAIGADLLPPIVDTASLKPVPKNPKKWPKYKESEQEAIRSFLTGYRMYALTAHESATKMFNLAPEMPGYEASMMYWRSVCSGIAWMLTKVDMHQRHLWIMEEIKKQESEQPK